jgi:hypothetical protein
MESRPLSELIGKIFGDERIKSQFIANPESIVSQFSLNEDEKKALFNTHAKLGLLTSDSAQLEAVITPNIFWTAPTP